MPAKMAKKAPKRSYASPARAQALEDNRVRIIAAATRLLRGQPGIANFSLDGVAKAAGVTRLTVYNQFKSRSGVLEAVFASLATKGGISRLGGIETIEPPLAALDKLVEIFCDFWGSDTAIGPIFDAMATDPEISAALAPRIDSGHQVIDALASRVVRSGLRRNTADLIVVLTNFPSYRSLMKGRAQKEIVRLLKTACRNQVSPKKDFI